VAGNSIESPRLLLNSASSKYPDGLANSSGQVGRNYMRHMTGSVYAIFDKPVHMYRGTTMAGIIKDEAVNKPDRGFVGGYEMETLSLGVPFMAAFLEPGAWGRDFSKAMEGYPNMAGMWLVGEDMPQEKNAITLHATEKDQYGLPVPNVHFDDHANDVAMREHAYKQGSAVYEAVGAVKTFRTPPYPSTHNLGTNRMSEKASDGVVNKYGQTHDIANLFISDGSQFTTGAAENPTLTIVALAIRQAEYIADQMAKNEI
jgi:choline dehydrogenase-like flavoprotein